MPAQAPLKKLMDRGQELEQEAPEAEELDWWSKYYASMEELERKVSADITRHMMKWNEQHGQQNVKHKQRKWIWT